LYMREDQKRISVSLEVVLQIYHAKIPKWL